MASTVSFDLARIVIRYASDIGLDPEPLWRHCGLDPRQRQAVVDRIPAEGFEALWQAAEAQSGDDLFGLRLGRAVKAFGGGHLLYAMLLNSPTVGVALAKFCRYHGILSDVVQPRLILSPAPAIWLEPHRPSLRLGLGQEAFIFGLFSAILQGLTGRDDNLSEVRFCAAAPKEISAYRRAFGCPLKFQCARSALFPREKIMDQPVFLANPDLLAGYEELACKLIGGLAAENTARRKTARTIARMLARGEKPSIDAVAEALAMSVRRLQQKLKSEQTGYREILDLARKETALRLLQDSDTTISEITFILGFSDQSAFTHAFQVWTGTTPGKYRRQM